MISIIATATFLLLTIFTILFQIGLVIGMPWGEYTMGGYNKGVLPVKFRITAAFSAMVLGFISYIVLNRSLIFDMRYQLSDHFLWFVAAFSCLAFIMNSVTQSQKERRLWQPITFVMFLCSLYFLFA